MKLFKYVLKGISVLFLFAFILACQEDFSEVGTDIVGQVNFDIRESNNLDVVAFSRSFPEGVQTNALPVGVLGYYTDDIYGTTEAEYLTQLQLSREDPNFGDNPVIDSVIFTLPYFSDIIETDADGNSTFELDSIFGNGPMRITAFRSNFFLNDLDPDSNFENPTVFSSNDLSEFSNLEGDILFDIQNFTPDDEEIILTALEDPSNSESNVITSRIAPALRVSLDNEYWEEEILDREGGNVLLNQNNFNEFFRGVYFRIEPINNDGRYILFDFSNANITLFYNFEGFDDSPDDDNFLANNLGSISLGFDNGIRVVGYENDFNLSDGDEENGDENLFLKGGNGSIALIDLFRTDLDGNGIGDQLEILRECNIIINEANLTFFVNQEEVGIGSGESEPERIFIYDFENNRLLADTFGDATTSIEGAVGTRVNHLGRLVREEEGNTSSPGISYRMRITRHLDNIINRDSTNVRLGIAVSQNVLDPNTQLILGTDDGERRIPAASVISPEGTVLHGNLSENVENRLQLRLFYTLTEDIDPNSPCGILLGLE